MKTMLIYMVLCVPFTAILLFFALILEWPLFIVILMGLVTLFVTILIVEDIQEMHRKEKNDEKQD